MKWDCCCKVATLYYTVCLIFSPPSELFWPSRQLFSIIPHHFLPGLKSPCWFEELSSELSTDPYRKNLFTVRSRSFKTVCDNLRKSFHQHLNLRDGKLFRLRCLPFFYIIGQPKCGTTDLFHRLLLHPEVKFNTMKEPHWWTRKRFGESSGGLMYWFDYSY